MSLNCNYLQLDMLQLSEVTVGRSNSCLWLQLAEVTIVWGYSCPNPVPEGHTDTPQLNNTPQLLAEYIQYKYISQKMYVPQPWARRAHRHPLNWIYSANNCGVLFTWGVSVCPSGTGFGNEQFLRYVFVLDIYCQQLWNVVHLRGCLCALRAQGWGMYIFREMYLHWI